MKLFAFVVLSFCALAAAAESLVFSVGTTDFYRQEFLDCRAIQRSDGKRECRPSGTELPFKVLALTEMYGDKEQAPGTGPAPQSATARVVEASIQSIEDLGAMENPRYRWTWRVHIVGAGGSCGPDEQADVGVLTNSATALPGTVTRCSAYADYVDNDLTCASNTVGTLGCDILTYALSTPL